MYLRRIIFLFLLFFTITNAQAQDVEFHLNAHLLQGKNILKVKRDYNDPYLWVLADNNEVYRVNSLDNTVENFTSTFSTFSSYKFIDIAGYSKDIMFIATSTNLIEYRNGTKKIIGTGLGVLNSIGIDYTGSYLTDNTSGLAHRLQANSLLIATSTGMHHYGIDVGSILPGSTSAPARVFEATYRNELFSDVERGDSFTGGSITKTYPFTRLTKRTIYLGWVGINDSYGKDLYSIFNTDGSLDREYSGDSWAINIFWATEKGLFQARWDDSRFLLGDQRQYLNGVKINKITSIYGLKAFGAETIYDLVKENILLATDKGFYYSTSAYWAHLPELTFFHYEGLGNTLINDVCVNATSYTTPVCEDGVWLAAASGLYLLKPDHGKFIKNLYNVLRFAGSYTDGISEKTVCSGTSITARVGNYTGNVIQWYKDGVEIPGKTGNEINISDAGEYHAVLYDPCSTFHVETNRLKVKISDAPEFTFAYPDNIYACKGSGIELKVGSSSSTNNYRWYKDGVLNGSTGNFFYVTQPGKYRLEASSCAGSWVSSKEVNVTFIELSSPLIKTDKSTPCEGETVTLSVNVPQDPSYTIHWLRDGLTLTGNDDHSTYATTVPGNYTVYLSSNLANCSSPTASMGISFSPMPTISISKSTNTPLCDGQMIDLTASYSNGKISWTTGETTAQIKVTTAGTYKAIVRSASCEVSEEVKVIFFPNPTLKMPDASLCEFTKEEIGLTAPAGFAKYSWNGVDGGRSYRTGMLGTVTLVVTDQNGCTATETINITSHCTDIIIPNTFTPNGDGINDNWKIGGISSDNSTTITVFNRNGNVVYQSRGYITPWDGQYRGTKLPSGSYYYLINTKSKKQILSGTVTIVY